MPKKRAVNPVKPYPKIKPLTQIVTLDSQLKQQLKSLPNWPLLKVKDWMPLACHHWKVDQRLNITDARYRKVHDFVQNAKRWRKTVEKRLITRQDEYEGVYSEQDQQEEARSLSNSDCFRADESMADMQERVQQPIQIIDQRMADENLRLVSENTQLKEEVNRLRNELELERIQKNRLREHIAQFVLRSDDIIATIKDQSWNERLEQYLTELKMGSLKEITVQNYDSFLRPWVKWLIQKTQADSVAISSHLLKHYLDSNFTNKSYNSYMRIGRQIVHFMNRYLQNPINLIKSISHQRSFVNVQMPTESIPKLYEFLNDELNKLRAANQTPELRKKITKVLAIYFVLLTGCRPSEASYVVLNKTIVKNDYHVPHFACQFKATAPSIITKTKLDYFWLLPLNADTLVKAIMDHQSFGFGDHQDLKQSLRSYFTTQVLGKAGVQQRYSTRKFYDLRSIRAFRATEWLKLSTEYKIMGWNPSPPNPLSHTNSSTIKQHYATKGSDNEWQARQRCYTKYNEDESLRQPWMDNWKAQI